MISHCTSEEQGKVCLGAEVCVLMVKKLWTSGEKMEPSKEYNKHFEDALDCCLLYLFLQE